MANIESIIGDISQEIIRKHSAGEQTYSYNDFKAHPGWKLHLDMLLMIKGKMAESLLSTQLLKLPEAKRLATQEAYAYINIMIDFLIDPLRPATKRAGLLNKIQQMAATNIGSGKRPKKGATKRS